MPDLIILNPPAAVTLRGDGGPDFASALLAATGLQLPQRPNTFTGNGERSLLWMGPDEWLLLDARRDGPDIETELVGALAGQTVSVCDVSGNRTLLSVSGERAAELLSRGCALDLAAMTPGESCAQTIVARAQVVLMRQADDRFDLMPRRSFTHYLRNWLQTAAAGL